MAPGNKIFPTFDHDLSKVNQAREEYDSVSQYPALLEMVWNFYLVAGILARFPSLTGLEQHWWFEQVISGGA